MASLPDLFHICDARFAAVRKKITSPEKREELDRLQATYKRWKEAKAFNVSKEVVILQAEYQAYNYTDDEVRARVSSSVEKAYTGYNAGMHNVHNGNDFDPFSGGDWERFGGSIPTEIRQQMQQAMFPDVVTLAAWIVHFSGGGANNRAAAL